MAKRKELDLLKEEEDLLHMKIGVMILKLREHGEKKLEKHGLKIVSIEEEAGERIWYEVYVEISGFSFGFVLEGWKDEHNDFTMKLNDGEDFLRWGKLQFFNQLIHPIHEQLSVHLTSKRK